MPGRPFTAGHDPRRNLRGAPQRPHSKTLRTLAREKRADTVRRLVSPRDQDEDRRIALEACKVLAAYSDGDPGAGNVQEEEPKDGTGAEEDARLLERADPAPSAERAVGTPRRPARARNGHRATLPTVRNADRPWKGSRASLPKLCPICAQA
jgi:hypothetical protein